VKIAGYRWAPWILIAFGLLIWPVFAIVLELTGGRKSSLSGAAAYVFLFLLLAGLGFCVFAPFIARLALPAKFATMLLAVILYLAIAASCLWHFGYWEK
jgi:hypothetical protein